MSTAYNVIIFSFALTGLILGIVALTKTPQIAKNTDAIGKNTDAIAQNTDAIAQNTDAIANSKFYLNTTGEKVWPFAQCGNVGVTADNAWVTFGLLDAKGGQPVSGSSEKCSVDGKSTNSWPCDYTPWIGKRASYFGPADKAPCGWCGGSTGSNPGGKPTLDQLKKCYTSPGCEVQSNHKNSGLDTCISRYAY